MLPGISQLVMFVSLEYFDKAQFYKQPNFGIVYDIVLKTHQQNMLLSLFAQASQECPGQGNYAAANANLDAFAPYWSAKGRPTLGICSNRCQLKRRAERCLEATGCNHQKSFSSPQFLAA